MVFARRTKRSFRQNLRELLWPSAGWRRTLKYIGHRAVRLTGTTHSVAAGLAVGASISFTPLLGTHFLQTALLCWLLRVNILAGMIGTAMGNPWTFPFMFWADHKVGTEIMGALGFGNFMDLPEDFSLSLLLKHPVELMAPFVLGGYVCAAAAFPVYYGLAFVSVRAARKARRAAIISGKRRQVLRDFRKNS